MLIVVSPAKTLDYDSPLSVNLASVTQPRLLDQSAQLIEPLRALTPAQVASLMSISDKLAALNVARFHAWQTEQRYPDARPAVFAFKGDVYAGLAVEQFSADDLSYAQTHFRMLSGLYGLLRPLDLMRPYRLEMGTDFANARGKNLYEFWGERITDLINEDLAASGDDVLLNLASQEYFKAVQPKRVKATIVSPQFLDQKQGQYKIISFYAKKARGLMAAWVLRQRIDSVEALSGFSEEGYRFCTQRSTPLAPVFIRDEPKPVLLSIACAGLRKNQ